MGAVHHWGRRCGAARADDREAHHRAGGEGAMSDFEGMGYAVCPHCAVLFLGLESAILTHLCKAKNNERVDSDVRWASRVVLSCLKSIELSRAYPMTRKTAP